MNRRSILLTAPLVATLLAAAGAAHAADPTTADCLAASDASLKSGNEHKLRAERAQLLVCAATSCPADIRKECLRRVDEVNAQIPTIVFAAKDATGADLGAVKVTMDGEVLVDRLEGTAISIDPGEHTFTFDAAGQAPVTKKLLIQEAQKERREAIVFGTPATEGPPPGPPGAHPPASPGPLPPSPPPPAAEGHGMGAQKVLALVAGGLGVVGIGVGSAFGLVAMSKKNDAKSVCPDACATQDGVNKWSDAKSAGNLSTIGFVAGGVLLAGGVVLWLTAPSGEATGPRVGLAPGGVLVKGAW
jgi:hypothetical protein